MIGAIVLALQVTSIAAGSEPSANPWRVDHSINSCIISRSFGDDPDPVVLAIESDPVSGMGNIVLIIPRVIKRRVYGTAIVTAMPGGASFRAPWSALPGRPGAETFKLMIGRAGWERMLAADTIEIGAVATVPILVPVKGIAEAVDAASACGHDLLETWGFDPTAMIDVPQEQTRNWFSPDDYPSDAFRDRQQGTVRIVGTVNADGKPVACRVVASSGAASLDDATCSAFMRRATFDRSATSVRYVFHKAVWINPN